MTDRWALMMDWCRQLVPDGETCLDVGAGIHPQQIATFREHFCVEPYKRYFDWLVAEGFDTIARDALDALREYSADVVFLLDVIEHMDKDVGMDVLDAAVAAAPVVVVFTPLGFMPQEGDAWG